MSCMSLLSLDKSHHSNEVVEIFVSKGAHGLTFTNAFQMSLFYEMSPLQPLNLLNFGEKKA